MRMNRARRFLIATAAGLALLGPLSGQALAGGEDAIEGRLQQYEARFNRGDAETVADLFATDVVYYDPTGQVHEGRAAVRTYYRGNLDAGFSDMTIETIEVGVVEDTAYDIARYTIRDPGGEPLTGYHLAILEKEDGEWLVQRTLVNAVMPAPRGE